MRIWVDGCFDGMHFGHANALRQAREMGDILVVGVHSDKEILANKGPTLYNEQERYELVKACRWVDSVVEDAPYVTSLEWMDRHGCDICVHGDDITTTSDGTDCYSLVKEVGRYKECKRTLEISTTDLVGRILEFDNTESESTTAKQLLPIFQPSRSISNDDLVVYVDGSFDLFHPGHVELLRQMRNLGTYVLVGIHSNATANAFGEACVMNMHERALCVLACRYSDSIVLDAPHEINTEFIQSHRINVIADAFSTGSPRFIHAKNLGKLKQLNLEPVSNKPILQRIASNKNLYQERNRRKEQKAKLEAKMKSP